MNWRNVLWAAVLCYGASQAGGCAAGYVGTWLHGRDPYVDGEWQGRLAAVTVRDVDGRKYQAVALDVSLGPRMPYYPAGAYDPVATERLPLLVESSKPSLMLTPEEMELSMGTLVRIRGEMLMASVKADVDGGDQGGFVRSISKQAVWQGDGELVIVQRARPEQIELLEE